MPVFAARVLVIWRCDLALLRANLDLFEHVVCIHGMIVLLLRPMLSLQLLQYRFLLQLGLGSPRGSSLSRTGASVLIIRV